MPNRSRSGVVSRPVRVVAPTSVKGGTSSVRVLAATPCPTMMSRRKSSSAGSSAIASCSLTRACPTKSSKRRGRSERSISSSCGCSTGARNCSLTSRSFESQRVDRSVQTAVRAPPERPEGHIASDVSRRPQRLPDALLRRQLRIGAGERPLRLGHRVAELYERVARDDVLDRTVPAEVDRAQPLLQLENDPLRRLPANARNRDEPGLIFEHDRSAEIGRSGVGEDRERHFRADAGHGQQELEQLALRRLGEAVQLERVLADMEISVEGDLLSALRLRKRALRRLEEVADAADVQHDAVQPPRDDLAAQARDHLAALAGTGSRRAKPGSAGV